MSDAASEMLGQPPSHNAGLKPLIARIENGLRQAVAPAIVIIAHIVQQFLDASTSLSAEQISQLARALIRGILLEQLMGFGTGRDDREQFPPDVHEPSQKLLLVGETGLVSNRAVEERECQVMARPIHKPEMAGERAEGMVAARPE